MFSLLAAPLCLVHRAWHLFFLSVGKLRAVGGLSRNLLLKMKLRRKHDPSQRKRNICSFPQRIKMQRDWTQGEPSAPAPSSTRQAYFFPQLMAPEQTGRQAPCPKSYALPARCRHVDMAPSITGRQSCLLAVRDFQREAGTVSVSLSLFPSILLLLERRGPLLPESNSSSWVLWHFSPQMALPVSSMSWNNSAHSPDNSLPLDQKTI